LSTTLQASVKGRIEARFTALAAQRRAGLITFITAGDPDAATSLALLEGLPKAGADLIELGMPFSDPMADGPAIQESSKRALKSGSNLQKTLEMVASFRKKNTETPIILMGYYNPIYVYGVDRFLNDTLKVGVDGLIIVDLPPEEDLELCLPARKAGLSFIRLVAPTTDVRRLSKVLENTSGFLYYISITGITGTKTAPSEAVAKAVDHLRRHTELPIAVGFGIRTPELAEEIATHADAVVVGSALVQRIEEGLVAGRSKTDLSRSVLQFVEELACGVRRAAWKPKIRTAKRGVA